MPRFCDLIGDQTGVPSPAAKIGLARTVKCAINGADPCHVAAGCAELRFRCVWRDMGFSTHGRT
jgi:hypothetical protein